MAFKIRYGYSRLCERCLSPIDLVLASISFFESLRFGFSRSSLGEIGLFRKQRGCRVAFRLGFREYLFAD